MGVWLELLIGEGFWLGLLMILAIIFIIASTVKIFQVVGGVFCLIMVLFYLENIPTNDFRIWGIVFMGLCSIVLFSMGIFE